MSFLSICERQVQYAVIITASDTKNSIEFHVFGAIVRAIKIAGYRFVYIIGFWPNEDVQQTCLKGVC